MIYQPLVLLNIKCFFDHLLKQIDVMVEQGFVSHTNREHLTVVSSPEAFLQFLKAYRKA
ncbi:MAG: LOG family protein [Cyclobacteriaceae bacterium]|nr:LOG family protein [Cyclobacteriaceae bacterium]